MMPMNEGQNLISSNLKFSHHHATTTKAKGTYLHACSLKDIGPKHHFFGPFLKLAYYG